MRKRFFIRNNFAIFALAFLCSTSFAAETFRVAAYNVENYLDQPTESRHFDKSAEAKAKIRESIHVAILSRLPIVARQPHSNDSFLLDGRRFRVGRGFAEVEIQAETNFTFTLIAAHLKSRRPSPEADEAELRLQEAKVLRGLIDEHLTRNPSEKIIVLGDFNDVKSSDSTKAVIGRGKFKLTDTRPAERNGDNAPNP